MIKKISSAILVLLFTNTTMAQKQDDELAKKLANPVAALISVPIQNNLDHGIGTLKGSRFVANLQPVIPFKISSKMNFITRYIVPIISQYNITGVSKSESGIGDAVVTGFFSPSNSIGGLVWGAGPVLSVPIGSNNFTSNQLGIGPSAILLKQQNGWTYGGLINQIWGTKANNSISQMLINPFLTYNWKSGSGITAAFDITQNWVSNQTNIYFMPMFSSIAAFGKQKISMAIGPKFNIAAPESQKSALGLRASLVLLFPK
jgi:hypothetical protein